MSNYHCFKCGWDWIARGITKPKQCPKCKRYSYDDDSQLNNMEVIQNGK